MSLGLNPSTNFTVLPMRALQLGESLLLVGIFRDLCAGEPSGRALGEISGDLYLAHERKHIGGKSPIEHHFGLDVALLGKGLGLLQNSGEIFQHLQKGRNRSRIHSERHGESPS